MSAKQLRFVTEETPTSIALDAPDAGLELALEQIAGELSQLTTVKRDVRTWALYGAAASSALTLAGVAAMMMFAFSPRAEAAHFEAPVAVVAPVAAVVAPAPVAVAAPQPVEPAAEVVAEPAAASPEAAPLDAPAAVQRALHLLFRSHARAALDELSPVLDAQPNNVDALAAQALALFDLHRDKAARAVVKKALALEPKHPMANVLRGFMAQVDHDVPQALRSYNRYLHQRPNGAFAQELSFVRESLSTTTQEERHE